MLCPWAARASRPFDAMSTSRVTPNSALLTDAFHSALRAARQNANVRPIGQLRC
jgi:hypothetical protein